MSDRVGVSDHVGVSDRCGTRCGLCGIVRIACVLRSVWIVRYGSCVVRVVLGVSDCMCGTGVLRVLGCVGSVWIVRYGSCGSHVIQCCTEWIACALRGVARVGWALWTVWIACVLQGVKCSKNPQSTITVALPISKSIPDCKGIACPCLMVNPDIFQSLPL